MLSRKAFCAGLSARASTSLRTASRSASSPVVLVASDMMLDVLISSSSTSTKSLSPHVATSGIG
jgi:hypothetical protein